MSLAGKTAIITGAAAGIGAVYAQALVTVLFENVGDYFPSRVVGGMFGSRAQMADALGVALDQLLHYYLQALEHPIAPLEVPADKTPVLEIHDPEVRLEVDNWTGFLRPFTHLTNGDAPVGDEKLVLVATLMGMGMNLGLTKMEQSCSYTYRQLSWSVDWYIREETSLASLARLDNFVLEAPLSRHWGDGTTSSSDGMQWETLECLGA